MSQPTPYNRSFSFTDFSTGSPSGQQPGTKLDAEFDALHATVAMVLTNLAKIQRDDGGLSNGLVSPDQFTTIVKNLIGQSTFNLRGPWVADTVYSVGDFYSSGNKVYLVMVAHKSSSIAADIAGGTTIGPVFYPDPQAVADFTALLASAAGAGSIGTAAGGTVEARLGGIASLSTSTSTVAGSLSTGITSLSTATSSSIALLSAGSVSSLSTSTSTTAGSLSTAAASLSTGAALATTGITSLSTSVAALSAGSVASLSTSTSTTATSLSTGAAGAVTSIASLSTGAVGAGTSIASLSTGASGAGTSIASLSTGAAGFTTSTASLSTAVVGHTTSLTSLSTATVSLSTATVSISTTTTASVASLSTGAVGAATSITSLSTAAASLSTGATTAATGITSLSTATVSISTANAASVASLSTGAVGFATATASLSTGAAGFVTSTASLSTGAAAAVTSIVSLSTATASISTTTTASVASLSTGIVGSTTGITSLSTVVSASVASLSTGAVGFATSTASLSTGAAGFATSTASLSTGLAGHTTNIASLSTATGSLSTSTSTGLSTHNSQVASLSTGTGSLSTAIAASGGSALVGFLQAGTGAVARTNQDKARETVSVLDFGAVGNGTTDDTAAIQAAINAVATAGGKINFLSNTYAYTALTMPTTSTAAIMLVGDGAILKKTTGTGDGLVIQGAAGGGGPAGVRRRGCVVRGIKFTHSVTQTAGHTIVVQNAEQTFLEDFEIESPYEGIYVKDCFDTHIAGQWYIRASVNVDIHLLGTGNPCSLIDTYISGGTGEGVSGDVTKIGLFIDSGCSGIYCSDIDLAQGLSGIKIASINGAVNPEYAFFNNVLSDSTAGKGWDIVYINGLYATQCWAATAGDDGFGLSGGTGLSFLHCQAYNNAKNGLNLASAATEVHVIGGQYSGNSTAAANTYHGINVQSAAAGFTITGARCGNITHLGGGTQAYGINVAAGASAAYSIIDNDVRNNSTGAILDGGTGTNKRLHNNLGWNPRGYLGAVSVPASTVAITNPYGVDAAAYVVGGTVTVIELNSGAGWVTTGVTSGHLSIAAGMQVRLTYTVAPAWTWFGV